MAFDEVARRHGDYALVGVAALVAVDDGRVTSARAGYLSVSDVPTVVDLTDALDGTVDDDSLTRAADAALAELEPAADIHATARLPRAAGAGADRPRAPAGLRRRTGACDMNTPRNRSQAPDSAGTPTT